HFFPGGKEALAAEILAEIDAWFNSNIFHPLERDEARAAINAMWRAVDDYFRSGGRVCLVGAFALDETRDRFADEIRSYFMRWMGALKTALRRAGIDANTALILSEEIVLGIQGALVLARATRDARIFKRTLSRLSSLVCSHLPDKT